MPKAPHNDQIIALQVIPKASKNEVVGWVMDADGKPALKIKVTTAPEDGKATKAVLELLAKTWGCSKSDLELVSGASSRYKRLKILPISLYTQITSTLS